MVDGKYKIWVDTALGPTPGTIDLHTEGDKVIADINAPVVGKQRTEVQLEGENAFNSEGVFKLLLFGKIEYKLHGEVEGESLRVDIITNKGDIHLKGTRES